MRDIIENIPEPVYTTDANGYIQMFNKAGVELWGREPVPGKDQWCGSWKIFDPHNGKEIPAENFSIATAIRNGRPVYGEQILVQRPDGSLRHVLPNPTPLFNEDGNLTGALNMLIDITDKKEAEEKFSMVTEMSPVAIFVYTQDHFLYANPAALKLSGFTKEDVPHKKFSQLIHPDDRDLVEQRAADRLKGKKAHSNYEFRIITNSGEVRWIEFSGNPIKYENKQAAIGIAIDITERKTYEKTLSDYKYALDQSAILSITDQNGIIEYVNDRFVKLQGTGRKN
ncbi:MAG: PAS domain S-box protein [Chitinophagaceae bacterium]|nr:PAS domain S-box protein [Chitinophagaceae bacterium]